MGDRLFKQDHLSEDSGAVGDRSSESRVMLGKFRFEFRAQGRREVGRQVGDEEQLDHHTLQLARSLRFVEDRLAIDLRQSRRHRGGHDRITNLSAEKLRVLRQELLGLFVQSHRDATVGDQLEPLHQAGGVPSGDVLDVVEA